MTERPARILIVDDDSIVATSIASLLESFGYDTGTAADGTVAFDLLRAAAACSDDHRDERRYDVVLSDVAMTGMDGIELLRRIRTAGWPVAVLLLTGYGTIESAVKAMQLGAVDYLTKPVVDEELRRAVARAVKHRALLRDQSSRPQPTSGLASIVGNDPRMREIYGIIESVAASRTTVLMTGESGTGKSLIARKIHECSDRRDKPFVELSCGSIPETLLESELFGHVKGAFTGAHVDKAGRFLAANEGTIFLDEINSASPGMQLKLLRVLQERRFEPVGSTQTIEVDTRVIVASNQMLEDLVAAGEFRQDLYYRINVIGIQLPPLRDRAADIPNLASHFLDRKSAEMGRAIVAIDDDAMNLLRSYDWPGNVRELENAIERAVVLSSGQTIRPTDLPPNIRRGDSGGTEPGRGGSVTSHGWRLDPAALSDVPLEEAMREPERQIILAALERNEWNRQRTAEELGINRTTLYKKIRQLDIQPLDQAG